MKEELENKLYKKYPELFQEKDLPMSQTCMCWGITCGDGWYKIIDNVCSTIDFMMKKNPHRYEQCKFVQVKEKFGTLRIYFETYRLSREEFANNEIANGMYKSTLKWWAKLIGKFDPYFEMDMMYKEYVNKVKGCEYYDGVIAMAERLSGQTCEVCGNPAKISNGGSWIQTVCNKCKEKK